MPPYLLNATLLGVMAQRLVRTLCPHCKQKVELNRAEDEAAWDALVAPWKSNRPPAIYKPVGCLECRMTGFQGRVGIYETLLYSQRDQGTRRSGRRRRADPRTRAQGRHEVRCASAAR